MKKILFAILGFWATTSTYAQDEVYKITAKTSGIADTTVFLISCNTDTIGKSQMRNGMFFFEGKVEQPNVAYIRPAGTKAVIPLMLENTNFQILAGNQGIKIVGGELQARYERYEDINASALEEQQRVEKLVNAALEEGNQMKAEGLQKDFMKYMDNVRQLEEVTFDSLVNSFVGMYVLSVNMQQMPRETLRERYDRFNDDLRQSPLGKAVGSYLEQVERIMEGKTAPDFTLPDVEGDTWSVNR